MRRISLFLVILGFAFVTPLTSYGQGETSPESAIAQQHPLSKEQEEKKLKLESRAVTLLEQVVSEAQALKLPENRVRVQIAAGDMLWARNQTRARGLFSDAGAAIAQMTWQSDRGDRDEAEITARLRRELVLTAARHDADLAFQLLSSTRPLARTNAANDTRFGTDSDTSLDQTLLSIIASSDPRMAYRKAIESLDGGEYPAGVGSVLRQLYSKDKEAFEKLSTKLLSKLTSDNLIASEEAGNLAVDLLRLGPIPEDPTGRSTNTHSANASGQNQALGESAYHDLMDATITAALTAGPNITTPTRDAIGFAFVTGDGIMVSGNDSSARSLQPISATQPNDERQNNARKLLVELQQILSQLDQYLPDRAQAMRQKLTELGISNSQMTAIDLDQGTSESLMTAAGSAPPQIQSQIYKQAAQKAIDEGNPERALQIATDHLDESGRNTIIQQVELKKTAMDASPDKLAKIRQKLAALPSDSARVRTLIDLAIATGKDNPKLALTFLDDARKIVSKRASTYQDFDAQLKVAEALAALDLKRSFDVLESGIPQLNEILAAAAVVNGFEAEVFREGELPLQGGSELGNMVARYGWELGSLAKLDFDHARMTADKFQLPESRLLAKLLIAQRVLGGQQNSFGNKRRD